MNLHDIFSALRLKWETESFYVDQRDWLLQLLLLCSSFITQAQRAGGELHESAGARLSAPAQVEIVRNGR